MDVLQQFKNMRAFENCKSEVTPFHKYQFFKSELEHALIRICG